MQSCDKFEGVFRSYSTGSGRVFAQFHIRGRNLDSPQYTGDQAAVKTMGFSERIGAEEGQGVSISLQGHEDGFCDVSGTIRINNLHKERTVNSEYYY